MSWGDKGPWWLEGLGDHESENSSSEQVDDESDTDEHHQALQSGFETFREAADDEHHDTEQRHDDGHGWDSNLLMGSGSSM